MKQLPLVRAVKILEFCLLAIFGLFLLFSMFASLSWRIEHDTALLHYAGFLIAEYGMIPYIQFVETSLPLVLFLHAGIGFLFGFGDFPIMLINCLLLFIAFGAIYKFLSPIGDNVALWAIVIFGLYTFITGQSMIFQRDFIGLVFLISAFYFIPSNDGVKIRWVHYFIIGFFSSLAFNIKPNLGIGLPILFLILQVQNYAYSQNRIIDFFLYGFLTAIGFAIPLIFIISWMYWNNALEPFILNAQQMLGPYNTLTATFEKVTDTQRLVYMMTNSIKMNFISHILPATVMAILIIETTQIKNSFIRKRIVFIYLFAFVFLFYPIIAGKFFNYHYIPTLCFIGMCASLCLYPNSYLQQNKPVVYITVVVMLSWMLIWQANLKDQLERAVKFNPITGVAASPKQGRVDAIVDYLQENANSDDTVLPLDTASGGVAHALLISGLKMAGNNLIDKHFYHHVSTPENKAIRRAFMVNINNDYPDLIIRVSPEVRSFPSGIDTSDEFPELDSFIKQNYLLDYESADYDFMVYKFKTN